MRTALVKVIKGDLHPYLKDIIIWGGVHPDRFVIYGCQSKDEDKFYQGIFDYDKDYPCHCFENVEEVKQYWEEYGDMSLVVGTDEYEEISSEVE
jgi:hypothetical protein